MNEAHWHLALNHFPIIGTFFSTALLAFGLLSNNQTIKNTAFAFFIISGLFAIPSLLTGEGAEDILESIGQKSEHFIHEHEELAEKAFWICELLAALSIIAMFINLSRQKSVRFFAILILLGGLINSYMMMRVSTTGGEIRHTEIRDTATEPLPEDSSEDHH